MAEPEAGTKPTFMEVLDKILSNFKDYHVPSYIFMFSVGALMQWYKHLDPTFVAFSATILGALTGHQFSPAERSTATNP